MDKSLEIEYLTPSGKWEIAPKEIVAQLAKSSYEAMVSGATIYGMFVLNKRAFFSKVQVRESPMQNPFSGGF